MNPLFDLGSSTWISNFALKSIPFIEAIESYLSEHQQGRHGSIDAATEAKNLEAIEYMNGRKKPDTRNLRKSVISEFPSLKAGNPIMIRTVWELGQVNTFVSCSPESTLPSLAGM